MFVFYVAIILVTGIEMGLFYIDNAYFAYAEIYFPDKIRMIFASLLKLEWVSFRIFSNFIANWMSKTEKSRWKTPWTEI